MCDTLLQTLHIHSLNLSFEQRHDGRASLIPTIQMS